ncbi:MAG: SCO7613 C-terminal domain-containing membrane protein, partial [Nocardioidaceae bacterium]
GTAYQVVDVLGGTPAWGAVAAAAVASLLAVGAQGLHRMTGESRVRLLLEATAVVVATVALAPQQTDLLALTIGLTLYGVAGVLVSLVSEDRRRVAWAGSVLLVLASWVRLFALEVDVVEAYTLPGAVALLVVGLLWMRRTPSATSWQALGAALGLGIGPSLLVALQEPTSWRAFAVGVVGLLLVGVGVRLTWGAPLLVGGVTVALLALVNVAPYAAGLPRWVLFGGAGVALLLLGVTWDRRRHDLVVAQRYATRLR